MLRMHQTYITVDFHGPFEHASNLRKRNMLTAPYKLENSVIETLLIERFLDFSFHSLYFPSQGINLPAESCTGSMLLLQ